MMEKLKLFINKDKDFERSKAYIGTSKKDIPKDINIDLLLFPTDVRGNIEDIGKEIYIIYPVIEEKSYTKKNYSSGITFIKKEDAKKWKDKKNKKEKQKNIHWDIISLKMI